MRNLTKTLAVMSLLAPASVYSLGIGDIKLRSLLNQNLNAEISLVLSAGEKASDIRVNLAAPDKFDEVGVPWTSFLSKIKLVTVVGAKGSVVVKLSSNEAVKEPFLDFLLEVSWPKGSLYREFTVLLDPPAVYKQVDIPNGTRFENYEPENEIFRERQVLKRLQTGTENSIRRASEYGPTRRNDTLWNIAERAGRQEGVSVEQMMIALYEENPHAFYQRNMNALLTGKTLTIPDRQIALKFSRNQALAELNRQTTAWKNRLTQIPIETAKVNKEDGNNQLTLIAPGETDISEKVEVDPVNEQTTTKESTPGELPAASEIEDKGVGIRSPVDDVLQDKVAELEKQLATMQQIIALKDQQLAGMQFQLQEKPVNQKQNIQAAPGQTGIESAVAQKKPAQAVIKPPVEAESEAFLDPYYLWVGGIGTGTLSLLVWVWWRKRKFDEETVSQMPFVASNMDNIYQSKEISSPSPNKNNVAYNAEGASERTFLSEISFADFHTTDADQNEIDPISEADVYLAYGRYQQAEELMRDALKDQPGRDECKLKLLEIIYSRKDKHAFEAYARELAETGKKDDIEFWAKVTEMGSGICPDSILFSSGTNRVVAEKKTIFEKNHEYITEADGVKADGPVTEIKNVDFTPDAFNKPFDNEAVKEVSEAVGGLLNDDLTFIVNDGFDEWKNNESIDFYSGGPTDNTELDKAHENVFWKSQKLTDKDEFEAFDFDLSEKADKEKELDKLDSSIVKGFDEGYQSIDILTDERTGLSENISNDLLEDDFDFLEGIQDSELTDLDELETKLDLAMAYIDMNDSDAAKDIAREVLEKGTPEQQLTAQALLERLK